MVSARARPDVTFADYLEFARDNDVKHEWLDGAIYAMPPGTPERARLSARVVGAIANALDGDCEVYSGDLMLYVAAVAYYRRLVSLQEYVLVSEDERLIEVYRRPATGDRWEPELGRAGGTVTIRGRSIDVDRVYGTPPPLA